MTFHWPFFRKPVVVEAVAQLRDDQIQINTRLTMLESEVHRPRPKREPRSDKASIIAAKAETTQRLMRMQGRGGL